MIRALFFAVTTAAMLAVGGPAIARDLESSLAVSGINREQVQLALDEVGTDQRVGMEWLITHMPESDLQSLSAQYLLENVDLAYHAWRSAPWHDEIPESVFLDSILPHASINERRDDWRAPFVELCSPLIADATSPAEAAAILNNKIFPLVGVKYSTKRPKADQSALESMEAGMASCTGLSVLLVDACRSVGVPARFVGTPLWSDGSGNHSWVEIWDEGEWHFTGAAEPTGSELNRAWFQGRAATAIEGDPAHSIFAVTWRDVPLSYPMVWKPEDQSVGAVDVTHRYVSTEQAVPDGMGRLRICAIDGDGLRLAVHATVTRLDGSVLLDATTRDERYDANDHIVAVATLGEPVVIVAGQTRLEVILHEDEQLVTVPVSGGHHATYPDRSAAEAAVELAVAAWRTQNTDQARADLDAGLLTHGDHRMPIEYHVHGDVPDGGRSLYISMHGGGGAPPEVNDRQWKNQVHLYSIDEGVYVAPRAPTDSWNLWHQGHIDPLFDQLITDMVLAENVDPDRVYLTGYSAGGDGTYQLAPRFADRLAGAAAMAGHPNETKPDGLRNLAFTIHMGGRDSAYDRNGKARQWKTWMADLQKEDPTGYPHVVTIHEDKGHWMDRGDAVGLPWMAQHTRDLRPNRIVWLQDDVTCDRFYWLKVDAPTARDRMVVERDGQTITIVEPGVTKALHIRLDDSMVDLDQPIRVQDASGTELFVGIVPRLQRVIDQTLAERGDPRGVFTAEITVELMSEESGESAVGGT